MAAHEEIVAVPEPLRFGKFREDAPPSGLTKPAGAPAIVRLPVLGTIRLVSRPGAA